MLDLGELQARAASAREDYDGAPNLKNARAASDAQAKVITAMQQPSEEETELGKLLDNRAKYYEYIKDHPREANSKFFEAHDGAVNDAVAKAEAVRPVPAQAASNKPSASAGLTDIASKTRDEFRKNRYITDNDGKTHDSYNFWSPAANVFVKPWANAFNGAKNFATDHPLVAGFSLGVIPVLVGTYELVRSIPGMAKDALKFVGNFLNATCNAVGAVFNGVCKFASGILDNIANALDGVAQKIRDAKIPLISPLISGALKCVSGPLHVVAKGVDKIGGVGQEACSAVGAVCRLASNPLATSSWKLAWRSITQTVANVAMVPVEMVKETGTQLKEMGNLVDVPIVSQVFRGAGNVVLASAVVTEGVVQGTKQFARLDNGFKSMVNGVKSGAATVGLGVKEAGQDFAAWVKRDEPARELGENQTKSAFGATVKVDQSHVVKPRSDAYEELTKETAGVLKENFNKSNDELAETQKNDAAAKQKTRAEKAGRRL